MYNIQHVFGGAPHIIAVCPKREAKPRMGRALAWTTVGLRVGLGLAWVVGGFSRFETENEKNTQNNIIYKLLNLVRFVGRDR